MKIYPPLLYCFLFLIFANNVSAQNIAINDTGSLPDTSAMLDVSSTTKGFLVPRMTTTQRNAIVLPALGLAIFNTDTKQYNVNTGTNFSPVWSPVATVSTTNILSSSTNTITSTVNGVAATAAAVNSNLLSLSTASLTSTVNGVATSSLDLSPAITAKAWGLTGNSSTSSSNYIGTSDGQPLIFKVNNTQAGYLGISGSYNTSLGLSATAGYQSTAIGASANASTNNLSTAIGYNANARGYQSIAIGANAQTANTNDGIAIGINANSNSYQGIAIGAGASTSSNNGAMAVGINASGYQSTAIGNGASATGGNSTVLGNGASVSNDNYISIGNTSVTAIRGQVNVTTYSDGRFKKNIRENVPGLDFIMKLRPVTYSWDIHKFNAHARGNDYAAVGIRYSITQEKAIHKKESITYTGFIAQEVDQAAQSSNFNFSGVLKPIDDKDAYSLSYAEFVVPLVKASQELNNKLIKQQILINKLQEEIKELKENKQSIN